LAKRGVDFPERRCPSPATPRAARDGEEAAERRSRSGPAPKGPPRRRRLGWASIRRRECSPADPAYGDHPASSRGSIPSAFWRMYFSLSISAGPGRSRPTRRIVPAVSSPDLKPFLIRRLHPTRELSEVMPLRGQIVTAPWESVITTACPSLCPRASRIMWGDSCPKVPCEVDMSAESCLTRSHTVPSRGDQLSHKRKFVELTGAGREAAMGSDQNHRTWWDRGFAQSALYWIPSLAQAEADRTLRMRRLWPIAVKPTCHMSHV
jgi:hypothetical protein